jgi:hypothetical protein
VGEAEHSFQRIARSEDVARVAGEGQAAVKQIDVAGGDRAPCPEFFCA